MASTESALANSRDKVQLSAPPLRDDPKERKRVLNVLAQRRYRKRKKEQYANLTQKLNSRAEAQGRINDIDTWQSSPNQSHPAICPPSPSTSLEVHMISEATAQVPSTDMHELNDPTVTFFDLDGWDDTPLEAYQRPNDLCPLPPLTPSDSQPQSDRCSPSNSDSTSSQVHLGADEVHLPMLELNLLRGAMAIAKRLHVDDIIWSLEVTSPFPDIRSGGDFSHLPLNLRPTQLQTSIPHHPALDILPWPSVRDKLILVFSQPLDIRPPNARSETALINFVYDLEDSAEGVRIWGDDPFSDRNWEIGHQLFKNWWWALDSSVLNRSNELRRMRGASVLGSKSTSSVR